MFRPFASCLNAMVGGIQLEKVGFHPEGGRQARRAGKTQSEASPLAGPVISIISLTFGYPDVLICMHFPRRTTFQKEITYSIQQLGRTQGDNAHETHLRWLANDVRYSLHEL